MFLMFFCFFVFFFMFFVFFGVFWCFLVFLILFLDSSCFSPSVALIFVENYWFRTIFGPFLYFGVFCVFCFFWCFLVFFILFLDSSRFSASVAPIFVENDCFWTILGRTTHYNANALMRTRISSNASDLDSMYLLGFQFFVCLFELLGFGGVFLVFGGWRATPCNLLMRPWHGASNKREVSAR